MYECIDKTRTGNVIASVSELDSQLYSLHHALGIVIGREAVRIKQLKRQLCANLPLALAFLRTISCLWGYFRLALNDIILSLIQSK